MRWELTNKKLDSIDPLSLKSQTTIINCNSSWNLFVLTKKRRLVTNNGVGTPKKKILYATMLLSDNNTYIIHNDMSNYKINNNYYYYYQCYIFYIYIYCSTRAFFSSFVCSYCTMYRLLIYIYIYINWIYVCKVPCIYLIPHEDNTKRIE